MAATKHESRKQAARSEGSTGRVVLTPQQQAIVAHDTGPALVYAVAGAGKTTAMVHRIARLVRARVFAPQRILATSFNRDANAQIKRSLRVHPGCDAVQVRTLHGLGYSIVRMAHARGYLPRLRLDRMDAIHTAARHLLHATVDAALAARVTYAPQLAALDGDDFLAYVRRQKAMLCLPESAHADLPRRLRRVVHRVHAPATRPWYADLYTRFEQIRQDRGLLTFDDMLVMGWLLPARFPDLRAEVQAQYDCVMVDEFQDVNRAQAELLDLVSAPHRNYMAIGDDDQTIYQWRGSDPAFIRGFRTRYRARVYFMTDNFRSRAVHLAMANQVIRHDGRRQDKYLQLTQGFGGTLTSDVCVDEATMAQTLARMLHAHHSQGTSWRDMAVLVRVYHQTPPIEAALTAAGIPCIVVGLDAQTNTREPDSVMITSIYRAKGLEWSVVCLPGCNAGILPYKLADDPDEERRLLYVALTRATQHLHLLRLQGEPPSPLLEAAMPHAVLDAVADVEDALAQPPAAWRPEHFLALAVNAKRLYLHEYFAHWWSPAPGQRVAVAQAVLRFYATLRQRRLARRLAVTRQDVLLWRAVAGHAVDESPLTDPALLAYLHELA